ncbi:MAG TPA: phosphoribosylamine--glycine ligase [Methylomirabilota bacterium]|nr:phosphoribosylamine--glycine ligase [Methylomirabilota bacterium]
MKVLLVGGGGREHALAWKIAASPRVQALLAAPGNPGIAAHAQCRAIRADATTELVTLAQAEHVDLTVVGPEAPLVAGLADQFSSRGLLALGPGAAAARLEGSKAYAKELMASHGIPTARFATFNDAGAARRYCRKLGSPLVVKADGLAAGKGAIVCRTLAEADRAISTCMEERAFGAAGDVVVVEEFLVGEEVSFFALVNGSAALSLGTAQDHKTVLADDRGPNTGGMGAYSPVPGFGAAMEGRVMETIVTPTIAALAKEGAPYRGVLFVGLMMTPEGPRVLEYNCRFGDPECQVLMTRLDEDLVPLLLAAAGGEPLPARTRWRSEAAVCVTLASGGYPGVYATGFPITGLEAAAGIEGVRIFHAGTAEREGGLVTAGGRVLGVTATGVGLRRAIDRAYDAASRIRFEGMHYRADIGRRGLR